LQLQKKEDLKTSFINVISESVGKARNKHVTVG